MERFNHVSPTSTCSMTIGCLWKVRSYLEQEKQSIPGIYKKLTLPFEISFCQICVGTNLKKKIKTQKRPLANCRCQASLIYILFYVFFFFEGIVYFGVVT